MDTGSQGMPCREASWRGWPRAMWLVARHRVEGWIKARSTKSTMGRLVDPLRLIHPTIDC